MPTSDFSFRDSFNPPPPPHFQYISRVFQTLVYGLLQKYLWEHVPILLYILLLSCSKHMGSLGAHMPASIWVPRKSSSKESDPVSYIVGWGPSEEMSGKPIQLSGDTYTYHQLLSMSCPLFCDILLVCIEGGHQWRSHWGGKGGGRVLPLTAKNLPKIGKNQEKSEDRSGRKGKNREVSFTLPLLTDRAGYATGGHWDTWTSDSQFLSAV